MRVASSSVLACTFLFACGGTEPGLVTVHAERSLRAAFDADDVDVVGVTVAPDTGKRYLLDADRGLFELDGAGIKEIAGLGAMIPSDSSVESAFTDVAALGRDRFAMTALNDGFLLDLDAGTFEQYFCYVPGEIIDEYPEPIVQMTYSLTYDFEAQLMYAQPRTYEGDTDGKVLRSQIGQFSTQGGEGFGWSEIEDLDFEAGGMTAIGQGQVLLGEGSKLHRYDMRSAAFTDRIDLGDYGIDRIDGMSWDANSGRVLIVDGNTDRLVEIELE
jgi:hypothetical protein